MTPPPNNAQPRHTNGEDLAERLRQEVSGLTAADLAWWTVHSVSPFTAQYGEASHFVIAVSGGNIIFFADDEDEFGVAKLARSSQTMTGYGLIGDLKDAVRIIQTIAA